MTRGGVLRMLLGLGITALAVWLMARQVQAGDLLAAWSGARGGWLVAALLCLTTGVVFRVLRYWRMLSLGQPALRWTQCSAPLLVGFALNNVLPLRAGDVVRVLGYNRRLGTAGGAVAAAMFVERLLDLAMLLCALGLALALFGLESSAFFHVGGVGLLAAGAAIVLLLMAPAVSALLARTLLAALGRVAPGLAGRMAPHVEHGLTGLLAMSRANVMAGLVALSAAVWTLEALMFAAVALALPALTVPEGAGLAFPVATLATLIPSSPGYIGTFDYFAALAMRAAGNAAGPAAAFAILVHLVIWLPVTVVGLACLWAVPPDRAARRPA